MRKVTYRPEASSPRSSFSMRHVEMRSSVPESTVRARRPKKDETSEYQISKPALSPPFSRSMPTVVSCGTCGAGGEMGGIGGDGGSEGGSGGDSGIVGARGGGDGSHRQTSTRSCTTIMCAGEWCSFQMTVSG